MNKKLEHVVLLGPIYPFKGGIAHYDAMLHNELKKNYRVTMVSYSMLYPKLLYKKEQRDYTNDHFKVEDTKYWVNSANPFSIWQAAKKIRALSPDMVILPWWHPYFAPCYRLLKRFLKGVKILYICHNVFPHERFPMDQWLTRWTLKDGDGYIVHSKMDRDDLNKVIANPNAVVNPLPTFNTFKMKNMTRRDARGKLCYAEDEKLLLFFGFVREYKGLKHLLRAMPKLVEHDEHVRLMVVGDFGENREEYMCLIHELGLKDKVDVVEGYVPDHEVEKYFAACDLVVLPYESATQSGIVQIAYGFEKPVVVTNVGGLPDVVKDGQTGYVVPARDEDHLAKAIQRYFAQHDEIKMVKHIQEEAYHFSWECLVKKISLLWDRMTP